MQLRIRARKLQRAGDLVADARKVLADVPKAKAELEAQRDKLLRVKRRLESDQAEAEARLASERASLAAQLAKDPAKLATEDARLVEMMGLAKTAAEIVAVAHKVRDVEAKLESLRNPLPLPPELKSLCQELNVPLPDGGKWLCGALRRVIAPSELVPAQTVCRQRRWRPQSTHCSATCGICSTEPRTSSRISSSECGAPCLRAVTCVVLSASTCTA